ncbi:hypothetical protein W911_04595 [Hyphomicrobium nitrativorans NL23]|uniref:HTH tetR-type domain-containing protein n=2 Tax=Hyphomicrobium TaxID=81 RepID=V5SIP6_9HYPH|nr:hypothetical protein W911_04595 [Hyphomicrobium nitrativorans NL23]
MRYPPDQKKKAREAIIQAGARTLRQKGFHGVGVDGLASAAGMTSGAFYSNFSSKDALLEEVIDVFLGEPFLSEDGPAAEQRRILRDWLKTYLSTQHRSEPASGCVIPSLSADVARAKPAVRSAYGRKMHKFVRKIADTLEGSKGDRERRAWSIVALMVGAISISRAMPDGDDANRALASALQSATAMLGPN